MLALAAIHARQIPIDRISVLSGLRNRREQQLPALFKPQHQALFLLASRSIEAGQNHVVELQAFGLVDGHELQPVAGLRIGLGEKRIHLLPEPTEIGEVRAFLKAFEQIEICAGVFESRFILNTCWSA